LRPARGRHKSCFSVRKILTATEPVRTTTAKPPIGLARGIESTGKQKALKAEQRGWVKGRDDCWKRSDVRGCVAGEYRSRIAELKDR